MPFLLKAIKAGSQVAKAVNANKKPVAKPPLRKPAPKPPVKKAAPKPAAKKPAAKPVTKPTVTPSVPATTYKILGHDFDKSTVHWTSGTFAGSLLLYGLYRALR